MSQEKPMSNEELHKMTSAMAEDLRAMKAQLDKERAEREQLMTKMKERETHTKALEDTVKKVKDEKKKVYTNIINEDIKPWMDKKREAAKDDDELMQSIDHIDTSLKTGLDNAFMDNKEKSLLRFVESVASAEKITSSTLARMLRTEQEWGEKYEDLMKQKEEIEKAASEKARELEESSAIKEKMVEDLKKELEELKATAAKAQERASANPNNVEGHFDKKEGGQEQATLMETDAVQRSQPPVASQVQPAEVTATASANAGKFDSIFDFRPRYNWRSSFADPGVSQYSTQFGGGQ
jgi:chromosome segregation ATPase